MTTPQSGDPLNLDPADDRPAARMPAGTPPQGGDGTGAELAPVARGAGRGDAVEARPWVRRLTWAALMAFSGGVLLPAVVLALLVVGIVAWVVLAVLLDRTGGLDPLTFGAGMLGAGLLLAGGTVLHVFARVQGPARASGRRASAAARLVGTVFRSPWRWLAGVLFAGSAALLLFELRLGVDLPDVLSTAFLLAAAPYAMISMVILAAWIAWSAVRWVYRHCKASEFLAGVVTATALLVALPSLVVLGGKTSRVSDTEATPKPGAASVAAAAPAAPGSVEGIRTALAAMAQAARPAAESGVSPAGSAAPTPGAPSLGAFAVAPSREAVLQQCFAALAQGPPQPPQLRRAIWQLQRTQGLQPADAEDVARDTLLKVCLRHAEQPTQNLEAYYWSAAQNGARDARRQGRRLLACDFRDNEPIEGCWAPARGPDDWSSDVLARRAEQRAWCTLDRRAQSAVLLWAQGHNHREIGGQLGVSEGNARQITSRAIATLQDAVARVRCRRGALLTPAGNGGAPAAATAAG